MRLKESLLELAKRAMERKKQITTMITNIHNSSVSRSDSVDPLSGAIDQFSNPEFNGTLAFPFVGSMVPTRFKVDNETNGYWLYLGRTRFKEFFQVLNEVRNSGNHSALWLYGTQGYGKSHMLAALVCYLAARGERVVYIPTCRTLLADPVSYVRAAMLFTWAGDGATSEIINLNDQDDITAFLRSQPDVIFVIDQMNAFDGSAGGKDVYDWIMKFTFGKKSVFSCSANYSTYLERSNKESQDRVLRVYGGLSRVSSLIFIIWRLLTRLGGNGSVVGAT